MGLLAVLAPVLLLGSGCVFGVYSQQDYGPGTAVMGVSENQSLVEVVRSIGAPDKVYEMGDTQMLVYYQYEGTHILGVYANIRKSDIVILLRGGKVVEAPVMVSKGEAITILGIFPAPIMGPSIIKED